MGIDANLMLHSKGTNRRTTAYEHVPLFTILSSSGNWPIAEMFLAQHSSCFHTHACTACPKYGNELLCSRTTLTSGPERLPQPSSVVAVDVDTFLLT